MKRNAIALLITVMFVMVISVAIAYGLKQVNEASQEIKNEQFIYQSSMVIEDVLDILANSTELKNIGEKGSNIDMYMFLSQAAFIPFESEGLEILLKLRSARSKLNIKSFNASANTYMIEYLNKYMVNNQYLDILLDNISGFKEDNSYNSSIFDENPYLYRDYIASAKHLEIINDFYTKEYNDNSLNNVDLKKILYFGADANTTLDLNYASSEVWEMILGASLDRATYLSKNAGGYVSLEDLNLNSEEKVRLSSFKTSFFEPYILVNIDINKDGSSSKISFEYDIKSKKGSNFVYEI